MIAADGREVALRDLVNVITDGGQPKELVGVMIDVTHRRQLEAELARRNELLRGVLDNIPVMLAVSDPTGRIVLVNKELERNLGWSLEEFQTIDVTERERAERRSVRRSSGQPGGRPRK